VLSEVADELISELAGIETCDDLQFKTTLAASFIYKFYLQMNKNLGVCIYIILQNQTLFFNS
jgi:hypothetical protein